MDHPRTILHADMDAFYASIEQRDDPALRGRPVIVGGTSARGVVAAASYESRAFGVHSAMPTVQARELCPDGVFLRGDMRKYARESKRIFEVFGRFSPAVQGISLDEAFLDLAGSERLLGPAPEVAERLRREVRAETGLAVSVGVAPVKMVAKIASDQAKPDGLRVVPPPEVRAFLAPLPVERIWGIGPVARGRLLDLGIVTIGELAAQSDDALRTALGSFGPHFAALARGEDAREVERYREAKSYGEENTFARDVDARDTAGRGEIAAAILAHADAVARRLRRDAVRGRGVTLKLKLGRPRASASVQVGPRRYPLLTRSIQLPHATDDGGRIAEAALRLLDRARLREAIRLVGVSVHHLESSAVEQLSLLDAVEQGDARRGRLNRTLDEIRTRFGDGALVRAGARAERAGLSLQIKSGED